MKGDKKLWFKFGLMMLTHLHTYMCAHVLFTNTMLILLSPVCFTILPIFTQTHRYKVEKQITNYNLVLIHRSITAAYLKCNSQFS